MRSILVSVACIALLIFLIFILGMTVEDITVLAEDNRLMGAFLFALVMCGATVVAPITVFPFIPMLAPILGPFTTGLSVFLGWMAGAVISFWIARTYGRPLIARFVSLRILQTYEKRIGSETGFFLVLLLRMLMPVDVLSYALGLFSHVSWTTYTSATALGIVWFSFAFAYLGDSVVSENYVLLIVIGVASSLVMLGAWYGVQKMTKSKGKI